MDRGLKPLLWVIAALLAANLLVGLMPVSQSALAQTLRGRDLGPRTVTSFPVQLARDAYGLAIVDADIGSVMVYEFETGDARMPRSMRLYAARSWTYDRALENYNQSGLSPAQVGALVQQQGSPQASPTPIIIQPLPTATPVP